jgi:hypothetical protein
VSSATQRNHPLLLCGREDLHRALRANLREILRDARHALDGHHEHGRGRDGPGHIEIGQRDQRTDLQEELGIERRGEAEAGRDPAGGEIGDDPGDLVEQKEVGELDRRKS